MGVWEQAEKQVKGDVWTQAAAEVAPKKSFIDKAKDTLKAAGKEVVGFGEGAANVATQFTTGAAGQAIAGLSGLATLAGLNPDKPALDLKAASDTIEDTSRKIQPLTVYTPQTEEGKKHAEILNTPFTEWSKGSQSVGDKLIENGHPTLGAVAGVGLEVLPLVAPFAGKAKSAIKKVVKSGEKSVPRPNHDNLTEGITAKDSLEVPPEVKPVVKGDVWEMAEMDMQGTFKGKELHQKGDAVYAIDPKAIEPEQAKAAIEQGGDAESAALGYPNREGIAPENTIDVAVTKQGETVTDLPQMKAEKEAGNIAWAAEGEPKAATAKAEEVAGAIKKNADLTPNHGEILDYLQGQNFVRNMKKNRGFASESDFQNGERQAEKSQMSMPQAEGNIAAGSLAYGMELPKYANNINLERVGADYSAKKLILDTADRYKGTIDEARRGTITHEETKALADDLGMTVDNLLKRRKGQAYNAEEATAARDILNTSAQRLREIQVKAAELGTDEALATFRMALDQHAAIQAEVSGAAAEAGRALSAHRIISSESKNYRAMLDALGGREMNQQILDRFAKVDTTNIKEVNSFIREFAKVKKSDMIYEAWINFLLSGPKTHIVNIASNTLTFLSKPFETAIASGYEAVASRVAKRPRERFIGEAYRDIVGGLVGMKEGVRAALKAWDEGLSSDTLIKVENAGKYQAIPGKTGRAIRIPGRALAAADEFFKSINYTAELYGNAYRMASLEGLRGEARLAKAAEYVQNPTKKMINSAKHEAQYRTFTQPYGEWSKILERTRRIPGVKYIIPFMRTPVNIAKFALERTPLNFARLAQKYAKGELRGAEFADEMAKPILGSLIAATAVQMVLEGSVTGGGPKDKTERDTLYRTGWQPYSFKIGDKYVSYSRMEPLASVFGMAADFTDLMGSEKAQSPDDYAEAIALSISKNLTSKTFLKGLSAAFDAMSDPKRYGQQFINNFAGSAIPSIVDTGAAMADDTLRNVSGPLDAMQNRLPFLSRALEPKRDVWGREVKKTGNVIERGFSPIQVTETKTDPVDIEINRLGMSPGLPSKIVNGVKLSPVLYDVYVERAGKRAYQMVSRIVPRKMSDDHKRDLIDKAIRNARRIEKQKFIREFRIK